jgi:cytochrome P450
VPDASSAYGDAAARCPVARVESAFGGFWAVMGHDTLIKAALDTSTFSNVVPLFKTRRPPLECDPPEHQFYRRLLNPYLSREHLATMEDDVRAYAREMIAPLVAAGGADFAEEFCHPFPTRVLCRFLAAPDHDWRIINRWGRHVDRVGGQAAPGSAERIEAGEEIRPYMRALIAARRARLGSDVVSGLIGGDPDLPPLDDEAVIGIVMMLISAGHNTTASAIGNLVLRLARDTELQRRLRDEPALIPSAVEETVRLDAPQQAMRRIATRDTELGGRRIALGDWVWLVFGAANLDAQAIERPTEFDVERLPNRHVGFGRGIHLCVGAPLARLQVRIAVEELLERTSLFEVSGPVKRPEWPRLGVSTLPLRCVVR